MSGQSTRGVVFVHSSPRALCPHVEWATGSVLNARVAFEWTPQPAAPEMFRAELSWTGVPGTGARLASALRGWNHLRYEVTEEASRGVDGGRWSQDRKSTRLNSSHVAISYAVFCLKTTIKP